MLTLYTHYNDYFLCHSTYLPPRYRMLLFHRRSCRLIRHYPHPISGYSSPIEACEHGMSLRHCICRIWCDVSHPWEAKLPTPLLELNFVGVVKDESKDALSVALEQCVVERMHAMVEVARDCGGITFDESALGGPVEVECLLHHPHLLPIH